jgi:hypothetical protein
MADGAFDGVSLLSLIGVSIPPLSAESRCEPPEPSPLICETTSFALQPPVGAAASSSLSVVATAEVKSETEVKAPCETC